MRDAGGLAIDNDTPTIRGTPTTPGLFSFTVRAFSGGRQADATLSVEAEATFSPEVPMVTAAAPASVARFGVFSLDVSSRGPEPQPAPAGVLAIRIDWDPATVTMGSWGDVESSEFWSGVRNIWLGTVRLVIADAFGLAGWSDLVEVPFRSLGPVGNTHISITMLRSFNTRTFSEIDAQYQAISVVVPIR